MSTSFLWDMSEEVRWFLNIERRSPRMGVSTRVRESGERQPVSTKNCVLVCASLTLVGSGLRVSPAAWFCRFTCKT